MFMKHYAPNRCLCIKVAKCGCNGRIEVFVKIQKKKNLVGGGEGRVREDVIVKIQKKNGGRGGDRVDVDKDLKFL